MQSQSRLEEPGLALNCAVTAPREVRIYVTWQTSAMPMACTTMKISLNKEIFVTTRLSTAWHVSCF
jgi:hypothetical protein